MDQEIGAESALELDADRLVEQWTQLLDTLGTMTLAMLTGRDENDPKVVVEAVQAAALLHGLVSDERAALVDALKRHTNADFWRLVQLDPTLYRLPAEELRAGRELSRETLNQHLHDWLNRVAKLGALSSWAPEAVRARIEVVLECADAQVEVAEDLVAPLAAYARAWHAALAGSEHVALQEWLESVSLSAETAWLTVPEEAILQGVAEGIRRAALLSPGVSWLDGARALFAGWGQAVQRIVDAAAAAPTLSFASGPEKTGEIDDEFVLACRPGEQVALVRWQRSELLLAWTGDGPEPRGAFVEPSGAALDPVAGPLGSRCWRLTNGPIQTATAFRLEFGDGDWLVHSPSSQLA